MIVTDVSGQHACPETSVSNETTPRNNQEEVRSQTAGWSLYRLDVYCDRRVARSTGTVLPEYVVNANNAVWPWGAAVVYDCCVALHPHPAAIFREEPEVFCRHLAFEQNCKRNTLNIQTFIEPCGNHTYRQV